MNPLFHKALRPAGFLCIAIQKCAEMASDSTVTSPRPAPLYSRGHLFPRPTLGSSLHWFRNNDRLISTYLVVPNFIRRQSAISVPHIEADQFNLEVPSGDDKTSCCSFTLQQEVSFYLAVIGDDSKAEKLFAGIACACLCRPRPSPGKSYFTSCMVALYASV